MIFRIRLPKMDEEFALDSDDRSWGDIAKDPDKKKAYLCICYGIILTAASSFVGKTIAP